MTEDGDAVARQMHVGFNAADSGVKRGLERRQRVFRMSSPSAAMALQIEQWDHQ